MRKLLAIGAASVALFGAVQALAADSTVTYDIQPTCEVQGLFPQFNLLIPVADGIPRQSGQALALICDDPNGATISLRTANGGLQSTTDPSLLVDYTTQLRYLGETPVTLTLVTDGTPLAEVTQALVPGVDLANPSGLNTTLTLLAGFEFSGVYTDTLSIDITGNP
ncbi:MAG: hypothetical protein ACR2QH_04695 [Geminicoccaceae bacterium]